MKMLLLSTAICVLTLSFTATAALNKSHNLKFVGDTDYASLCEAAATNDIRMFKSGVKKHAYQLGTSKKQMLNLIASQTNVSCAGQSLVEFSQARGSQDIENYITGHNSSLASSSAPQDKYQFVGDTDFKNFCKAALTDNVSTFKTAVSKKVGNLAASNNDVIKKVLAENNVTCGGKGLTEFFQQRNATNVMQYIADKISR